ncbi:MAG: hypothetical protein CMB96_02925 [Flavobacteriaceae bacterium]|nr:hypothetical protein [Flavobacteriaceae bacterium]
MDGSSTESKVNLLFKEANNTVDVVRFEPFTNPQNAFPFQNYVQNDEIFSNNIPTDLSNINYTIGTTTYYGSQALDISLSLANQPVNTTVQLTPDLVYRYRVPLTKASTQIFGTAPKRTWYVPDPNNPGKSLLSDSIAYNYDPVYNSYLPSIVDHNLQNPNPYYSPDVDAIWWRMDYKSGFLQLYGEDANIDNYIPNISNPPHISFIQYVGPKGAGIGGVVNGGDASFNNVDISDTLIVKNLDVTHKASLPEETLIIPKWDGIEGSNTNNPQFPAGYPKTEQVVSFELDPSTNLITNQDWVTIAYCAENVATRTADARADGVFKINYPRSSAHDTITFQASSKYGRGNGINVFQNDWYSTTQGSFDALRIVTTNNVYDGALLQIRFKNPPNDGNGGAFTVRLWDNYDYPGWRIYNDVSGTSNIGLPIVTKDNNPVSQFERFDSSGASLGNVPLTQVYLLDELNWNPVSQNVNQLTRNPALFKNVVRIDGDTEVNGVLNANNGLITNEIITDNHIIGQSPNQIINNTSSFTLNTSVSQGDWISIARIGEIQTSGQNISNRAFGEITLFDNHSGHNQHIRFTAGVMLEEGNVLEAIKTGQLTPNAQHVWDEARLVVAGQFDGAILQVKVGQAALVGSANIYRLTLSNSVNNPGWILSSGSLSNDSNPTIYTGNNLGFFYSQFNILYVEIPLDYGPSFDKKREVGKITAIPTLMQKARLQVFGENMFCQKDPTTSFGGTLGSVDGRIQVESSSLSNSFLALTIDSNGNTVLTNNNFNQNPNDMIYDSEGTIIFDNQTSKNNNAGIVFHSNDGVFIDCSNTSGNGNVTFRFGPSSNYQSMSLNSNGLDMNSHDISNVDTMYTKNVDFHGSDVSLNIGSFPTTGWLSAFRQVNIDSPMRLFNSSNAINILGGSSDLGSVAWSNSQAKIGVKFQNTAITSSNNVKYLKYEETYELAWNIRGYIALGLRQNNDPTRASSRTFKWNRTFLHHYSAMNQQMWDIASTTHGYFIKGFNETIHRDTSIERVLVRTFNNYARINNNSSVAQTVTFETWIGVTSTKSWSFNTILNTDNYPIPQDIINGTNSSTCRKLHSSTKSLTSSSNVQFMYNPFTTAGSTSPADLDIDLTTLAPSNSALLVPNGSYVALYCIERCNVAGATNSNGREVEIENYLNGDNWGNAGVPMLWEFFGKQKSS